MQNFHVWRFSLTHVGRRCGGSDKQMSGALADALRSAQERVLALSGLREVRGGRMHAFFSKLDARTRWQQLKFFMPWQDETTKVRNQVCGRSEFELFVRTRGRRFWYSLRWH